jgi:hypothetical protein
MKFLDSNDNKTYDKNDTKNDKQYLPYDIFLISFVFHNFTLMRYKHILFSCFKHFLSYTYPLIMSTEETYSFLAYLSCFLFNITFKTYLAHTF